MAGYKQKIQSHNPVMFITFDGDPFDPATRKITAVPPTIMDETPYQNNGMLHNESEEYPAYRMGMPSLCELEPTAQHAISFGWYGNQPNAPTRWPKSFIEVTHQDHLALEDNFGSFSIGFIVNKESNEQHWRDVEQQQGGSWNTTLIRPLIRKAGVFYIWYQDNWTGNDFIYADYPDGRLSWVIPNNWFYNRNNVINLTWEVRETDPGIYIGVARLYVNARIVAEATHEYFDVHPSSTSSAPIEIAGTINAGGTAYNDRATSNTMLDQMYILNKALSADEIATLYKKCRTYDNLILNSIPLHYWSMSDIESETNNTMVDLNGTMNGVYLGGTSRVLREQAAPPVILGGASVQFLNGGTAAVHDSTSSRYSPIFNPSGDFTIEFWTLWENSSRSILFSMQRDDTPYGGILIEANMRNDVNSPGHIQFSVSQDYQVSSRLLRDNGTVYNFADGQFHHVCAIKRGLIMELWIDGVKHGELDAPTFTVTSPGPGQIYLMGSMPGKLNTTGNMSCVATYQRALDPQEIRIRTMYSQIYRIKGTVTLQGNPHQATVRALKHRTGELEREVLSDNNTGDYMIELYDNSLIDIMALNKQDRNIRYRVYGPITPTVFEDHP